MAAERVRDLVTGPPVVVGPESSLRAAAQQLARAGQGAAVVGQTRRVDGVLCERALVGAVARGLDLDATPVHAVMTPHFASLDADTSIDEAQREVREVDVHLLAVTAASQVVGLLAVEDVLRVPSGVGA